MDKKRPIRTPNQAESLIDCSHDDVSFSWKLRDYVATCKTTHDSRISHFATCDKHVKTCDFEAKGMRHVFQLSTSHERRQFSVFLYKLQNT